MKVTIPSAASAYLTQHDLDQPLLAVITGRRQENLVNDGGQDAKDVLCFEGNVPMMVMRTQHYEAIIAAYGDDDDNWIGKTIEIYRDPSIKFGKRAVGGIRVRIPAAAPRQPVRPAAPPPRRTAPPPAPVNGRAPARPAASPARTAPPPRTPPTPTPTPVDDKLARVLDGIRRADSVELMDRWMEWAGTQNFGEALADRLADAYHERKALLESPAGPPKKEEAIPF